MFSLALLLVASPAFSFLIVAEPMPRPTYDQLVTSVEILNKQLKEALDVSAFFLKQMGSIVIKANEKKLPQGIVLFDQNGSIVNFRTAEEIVRVALLDNSEAKANNDLENQINDLSASCLNEISDLKTENENMKTQISLLNQSALAEAAALNERIKIKNEAAEAVSVLTDRIKMAHFLIRDAAKANRELANSIESLAELQDREDQITKKIDVSSISSELADVQSQKSLLVKEVQKQSLAMMLNLNTSEALGYTPLFDGISVPSNKESECKALAQENDQLKEKLAIEVKSKDECNKALDSLEKAVDQSINDLNKITAPEAAPQEKKEAVAEVAKDEEEQDRKDVETEAFARFVVSEILNQEENNK